MEIMGLERVTNHADRLVTLNIDAVTPRSSGGAAKGRGPEPK